MHGKNRWIYERFESPAAAGPLQQVTLATPACILAYCAPVQLASRSAAAGAPPRNLFIGPRLRSPPRKFPIAIGAVLARRQESFKRAVPVVPGQDRSPPPPKKPCSSQLHLPSPRPHQACSCSADTRVAANLAQHLGPQPQQLLLLHTGHQVAKHLAVQQRPVVNISYKFGEPMPGAFKIKINAFTMPYGTIWPVVRIPPSHLGAGFDLLCRQASTLRSLLPATQHASLSGIVA